MLGNNCIQYNSNVNGETAIFEQD